MLYSLRKFVLTLSCLLIGNTVVFSQLYVSDSLSVLELVKLLDGPGVEFDNIITSGCGPSGAGLNSQMGYFDATMSNVPISQGVLMTSGSIFDVVGPNNQPSVSTSWTLAGDPDLDIIVDTSGFTTTNDACIVEFDLRMTGDTLRFNFAFGSEEYPQFAPPNGNINDVFGFFISGPDINGPFSNNSENIALLPDGITPVSINTINAITNTAFFIDNGDGGSEPQLSDSSVIQYNGFTDVITAITPIKRCELYHIKLAIADAQDFIFDSGVFLEAGSFTSNDYSVNSAFANVYEGCKDGGITFKRENGPPTDSIEINLGYGGTALNGVDYGMSDGSGGFVPMPSTVYLAPFVDSLTLEIPSIDEDSVEEGETIIIYLLAESCSGMFLPLDSFIINLYDEIEVECTDTTVCPGTPIRIEAKTPPDITSFRWDPFVTEDTTVSAFDYAPYNSIDFVVFVRDTFGCIGSDTANIEVPLGATFTFTYEYYDPNDLRVIRFCPDNTISGFNSYLWSFNDGTGATSVSRKPIHTFPDYGRYDVTLVITPDSTLDCDPAAHREVIIEDLVLPNIMTPNGDGINDIFEIRGMYNYELALFNQWGRRVYFSESYTNDFDGTNVPDGVYYYSVHASNGSFFKGWLSIMR